MDEAMKTIIRDQLIQLRVDISKELKDMRQQVEGLKAEVHQQREIMKKDVEALKKDLNGLKKDVLQQAEGLKRDMRHQIEWSRIDTREQIEELRKDIQVQAEETKRAHVQQSNGRWQQKREAHAAKYEKSKPTSPFQLEAVDVDVEENEDEEPSLFTGRQFGAVDEVEYAYGL